MNKNMMFAAGVLVFAMAFACRAEDAQLAQIKLQLVVDQAGELYDEACRKGSDTHTPAHKYYFGLIYASGTNLLARTPSSDTTSLTRQYMEMVQRDYKAYTKVETAVDKAAATGSRKGSSGSRTREARKASAERLGEKELASAIKKWEDFAVRIKNRGINFR